MEQLFWKFAKLFYENTSVLQFAYWKVSWLQIAQRGKSFSKTGPYYIFTRKFTDIQYVKYRNFT